MRGQVAQPQDVTSSLLDAEGSICSQRSCLTRPKDLLATLSKKDTRAGGCVVGLNMQADGGGMTAFREV